MENKHMIVDALPGQRFYFENNKNTIFTLIAYITKPCGFISKCKCWQEGKLYPVYLKWNREVIIIKPTKNEV